jgi:hypothetical protein
VDGEIKDTLTILPLLIKNNKVCGVIPPLPQMCACYCAQLSAHANFIFTLR